MKKRLDVMITELGLATSRERAKSYIMEGIVYVDGQKETKAGTMIPETAKVEVKQKSMSYVSRGGYKLEKAFAEFDLSCRGLVCMDIGASTGGFTDCMLKNGAAKVYSVDVGYGQFDWGLRQDERVVCMEKTNIRYLKREEIGDFISFASIDVSFISLTKILENVKGLLASDAVLAVLIKPQFEAGREKIGKKGVVRDVSVHREVIKSILDFASGIGFFVSHLTYSPIKGPEGNIEYLTCLRLNGEGGVSDEIDISETVAAAHAALE